MLLLLISLQSEIYFVLTNHYIVYVDKFFFEYFVLIYLNSGDHYCFRCVSQEFANRVMEALRECINMPNSQITVDFANSKINNSPITFGNENHVTR